MATTAAWLIEQAVEDEHVEIGFFPEIESRRVSTIEIKRLN